MRRDNVNYLLVGLFVLGVGVAFLWVLYQLTGATGPTDSYFAYYDNVSGVNYGTVTYYKGFQVGQVEAVTPEVEDTRTRYRVTFSVTRGWKMPAGSVAAIVLPGPLAPAVVDIREGDGPGWLEPGSELDGAEQADLFAVLNDVAADFRELSREGIQPMLKNLNDRVTALSTEYEALSREELRPLLTGLRQNVNDPELFARLKQVLAKLDASAEALLQTLNDENRAHFDAILANADHGSAQLNELLARIESTRGEMYELLAQMQRLVAENRGGVTQSVTDASVAMADLRASISVIEDNIESIVHHLEGSSRNMQEFSREIRENPAVLFTGETAADPLPAGK